MTPDDQELRARFGELKRRDSSDVPEFRAMWGARPRPARSPWRRIVPVASLSAAAMFVLWCGAQTVLETASAPQAAHGGGGASVLDPAPPDPAPLDFLLDVPSPAAAAARLETRTANPIRGW